MSRRIPSCIGFDAENLEWLRKREEGMADFLNKLVLDYRVARPDETAIEDTKEHKETMSAILDARDSRLEDDRIKIKAFFLDSPHIIYMAKTQRKFKRDDLCRIKEELFFSKYNVDTTIQEIRNVLKEEMLTFNVEKYEQDRGIMKKV